MDIFAGGSTNDRVMIGHSRWSYIGAPVCLGGFRYLGAEGKEVAIDREI